MAAFRSIRARLTAWYALGFALFELVFAVASYAFVARTTMARVDEELGRTADAIIEAVAIERAGGLPPARAVEVVMREFRLGDATVAVLDGVTGAAALAFDPREQGPAWRRRLAPPGAGTVRDALRTALRGAPPQAALVTLDARARGAAPLRLFTVPTLVGGRPFIVGVARSLAPQRRTLAEARTALLVGAPLFLVLAVAGGWALARRGLAPVAAMTERAAQLGAGTLHERLPVHDPRDELGRLAVVFNGLLARLEDAFARQRRFMAETSHELRTPVAIIAGESELALAREGRDAPALAAALGTVHEEAERLQRIVEELFLLARADAGERPLLHEELYLADLVAEVAQAVRTLAARRDVSITVDAAGDLPFRGDEALLRRLFLNLLDNAIKYTPPGGRVRVAARDAGAAGYRVEVADTGPGIPEAERERIFERFARGADAARSGASGAGLGLAIARWIAGVHGGRVELARTGPGGSAFAVVLPARGPAAGSSGA